MPAFMADKLRRLRRAGSYYRRLFGAAFHGAWATVGWVSTIAALVIPLCLKGAFRIALWRGSAISQPTVDLVNDLVWMLPLSVFAVVFAVRLLLSPFLVFEQDAGNRAEFSELQNSNRLLKEQLDDTKRRYESIVQRMPAEKITDEQERGMVEALQKVGPQTVAIHYYDSPIAKPGPLLVLLQSVFNKAGWHVTTYAKPDLGNSPRLTFKYDRQHPDDAHRAIMDALKIGELNYMQNGLTAQEFREFRESRIVARLIVGAL